MPSFSFPRLPRFSAAALAVALTCALSGCVSVHLARKDSSDAIPPVLPLRQAVRLAPLDLAVQQTDLQGVTVERPEWQPAIAANLTAAFSLETTLPATDAARLHTDTARLVLADAQALLRAHTANHFGRPAAAAAGARSLRLGRIDALADELEAEALLFVFTCDRSTTAARKLAAALPTASAMVTGVNAGPRAGFTVAAAALVARDGEVLWFHTATGTGDLRDPFQARQLIHRLTAGLPLSR